MTGLIGQEWFDPAGYGYTQTLAASGWAWEFLRRNEKYDADWRRVTGSGADPELDVETIVSRFEALDARAKWGVIFRRCSR